MTMMKIDNQEFNKDELEKQILAMSYKIAANVGYDYIRTRFLLMTNNHTSIKKKAEEITKLAMVSQVALPQCFSYCLNEKYEDDKNVQWIVYSIITHLNNISLDNKKKA